MLLSGITLHAVCVELLVNGANFVSVEIVECFDNSSF